jgi:hypothetical protein
MLAYGIYEIGLIKMQLWLFLGAQIIIATLTIKTQMIYKDMEKMNILIQKNKTTIKCSLLKSS